MTNDDLKNFLEDLLTFPQNIHNLFRFGAKLYPIESVLAYCLILPYLFSENPNISIWLHQNLRIQTFLFGVITVVPYIWTKHVFYADIAWAFGIMMIGIQLLNFADFLDIDFMMKNENKTEVGNRHALLAGIALTIHGAKLGFGATILYFPFSRTEELRRYQYAKLRFIYESNGAPYLLWRVKKFWHVFQQFYANAIILGAVGALLVAVDTSPTNSDITPYRGSKYSWIGLMIWCFAWCFEFLADYQKRCFLLASNKIKMKEEAQSKGVVYVCGYAPFDGIIYYFWTLCRHPNYFGEWLCWTGLVISISPCLYHLYLTQNESLPGIVAWAVLLLFIPRYMYDVLMYWTGAAQCEHFSLRRRGAVYARYQLSTRCFFPFPIPFINHAYVPGWSSFQ